MQRWTLTNGERRATVCDYEFCADWSYLARGGGTDAGTGRPQPPVPDPGGAGRTSYADLRSPRCPGRRMTAVVDFRQRDAARASPARRDETRPIHRHVLHAVTSRPAPATRPVIATRSHCRAVEAALRPRRPPHRTRPPCSSLINLDSATERRRHMAAQLAGVTRRVRARRLRRPHAARARDRRVVPRALRQPDVRLRRPERRRGRMLAFPPDGMGPAARPPARNRVHDSRGRRAPRAGFRGRNPGPGTSLAVRRRLSGHVVAQHFRASADAHRQPLRCMRRWAPSTTRGGTS